MRERTLHLLVLHLGKVSGSVRNVALRQDIQDPADPCQCCVTASTTPRTGSRLSRVSELVLLLVNSVRDNPRLVCQQTASFNIVSRKTLRSSGLDDIESKLGKRAGLY
ncbi:hypothetical protein J6590_018534 [Homalodisca vitripennis]|nr:hypothetical protein J6590_018534 [Homalodisca vitripennis]